MTDTKVVTTESTAPMNEQNTPHFEALQKHFNEMVGYLDITHALDNRTLAVPVAEYGEWKAYLAKCAQIWKQLEDRDRSASVEYWKS